MRSIKFYTIITLLLAIVAIGCKTHTSSATPQKNKKGDYNQYFKTEADKIRFDDYFFEGTKLRVTDRYDEAIPKFEECLSITDKVAEVYYQLYICYSAIGRTGEAEMLNKAIALEPKNSWYLEEKVEVLKNNRRYQEAADVYLQLIEVQPNQLQYYEDAGNLLIQAGKHEEAIKILDKMESKFGISEEIIRKKENLYLYLNRPFMAIAEVQKLVSAMPGNTEYMGLLAELYAAAGQNENALEYFTKILAISPNNGKAHFGMANIYRQLGDSANTAKSLLFGFTDPEVSLKEKINVLLSMVPMGDSDTNYRNQVLDLARTMVMAHPLESQSHAMYGDLLFGNKQLKDALVEYEVALKLDANNQRLWQQTLSACEQLSEYKKLDEKSDEALELFPNKLVFYYYSATAAYHIKNYKKAAATAQAGIDMAMADNFLNMGLYSIAGDAYYKLKEYTLCYLSFDAALGIDPNNSYVLNNYAYYLSEQGERLEKALAMAKQALEIHPESPSYLDTYGWILYKTSRYDDAVTYIEKAHKIAPNDKEILEHLGDVNYRLGNKDKAVEYWRKSKEFGNDSAQLDKKINEGKLTE